MFYFKNQPLGIKLKAHPVQNSVSVMANRMFLGSQQAENEGNTIPPTQAPQFYVLTIFALILKLCVHMFLEKEDRYVYNKYMFGNARTVFQITTCHLELATRLKADYHVYIYHLTIKLSGWLIIRVIKILNCKYKSLKN